MYTVIISNVANDLTYGGGTAQFAVRNDAIAFAVTSSLDYVVMGIAVYKITEVYDRDGSLIARYANGTLA